MTQASPSSSIWRTSSRTPWATPACSCGSQPKIRRVGRSDGPSLLCPDLIGRAAEIALLRGRVDAAAAGRGGVVGLVAGAGAGKTRLAAAAAEAAAARGCPVLTGRAVPGPNAVPYRALVEAFLGAFRSAPVPDSPALAGLGGHLGRLVPGWRRDDVVQAADDSPLLLAEAIVRLLRAHGDGRGCV